MKILVTAGLYAPHVGGAERVAQEVAEGMAARGHQVTVATASDPRRVAASGPVAVRGFEIAGNLVQGIQGAQAEITAYRELLLEGGFDLSFHYAAQIWSTDLVLPILDRLPHPAVLAPCGYSGLHDPAYGWYFQALAQVLPGFAAVVHHSDHYQDARFDREHGVPGEWIPNGVDAPPVSAHRSTALRASLNLPADGLLVLHVGNHSGLKGHDRAIAAFQEAAPATEAGSRLVLVGHPQVGGCADRCRAAAAADPRIVLVEDAQRPDVWDWMAAADLFVFPSEVECAPVVLLEAMARGLPWISTPVGNVASDLAGGRVCTPEDLPAVLRWVMERPEWRRRAGAEGLARHRKTFRLGPVLERYEEVFRRASRSSALPKVDTSPFGAQMALQAAGSAARAGDWPRCDVELERACVLAPQRPGLRIARMQSMLRRGDWDAETLLGLAADECALRREDTGTRWLWSLSRGLAGQPPGADASAATREGYALGRRARELGRTAAAEALRQACQRLVRL